MEQLTNPFTLGLLLGIAFAFIVAISGWSKRRTLVKDIRLLRDHLQTQTAINAKGNQSTLQEIEQLKLQNEILRITLATLINRPDKSE